jgi:phage tail sheath protein FI
MDIIGTSIDAVLRQANKHMTALSPRDEDWLALTNVTAQDGSINPAAQAKIVMSVHNITRGQDGPCHGRNNGPADADILPGTGAGAAGGDGQTGQSTPGVYIQELGAFSPAAASRSGGTIDVHLICMANFSESSYAAGVTALSQLVSYFQYNPVFAPIDPRVSQLTVEFASLSAAEIDHVLSAMGTKYLPSAFFRLRIDLAAIKGVETSVPIFVGYTQTSLLNGRDIRNKPVAISSLAEYHEYFGFGPDPICTVTEVTANPAAACDFEADSIGADGKVEKARYALVGPDGNPTLQQFILYAAVQSFFANGGGNCTIVSVNIYGGDQPAAAVRADELIAGLAVAADQTGPTILAAPDACLLPPADGTYGDYAAVTVQMLTQAATLGDRVAILDLPGALDPASWSEDGLAGQADAFYAVMASATPQSLRYGAAYAPALQAANLTLDDIDHTAFRGSEAGIATMNALLTAQAELAYRRPGKAGAQGYDEVKARIDLAFPRAGSVAAEPPSPEGTRALEQYLRNAVPLLSRIEQILVDRLNIVPPSGAIAGLWVRSDADRGVWTAPANIALAPEIKPKLAITDEQQGALNIPLNGNAINAIRAVEGRGTVVWGARTLDGNSEDWRYIQVRRTAIYIEQSIKTALQAFVFSPNTADSWFIVTGMLSDFLTEVWQSGGLVGDTPGEAFTVSCGLGNTMTAQDVLNGYMIVSVTLALLAPAEFIELTFTQQMAGG